MGLFGSNNDNTSTTQNQQEEDTDPKVRVEKTVPETKEYTEHTALVRYPDGSEEEIVFDEMRRKEHCIILENYKGYSEEISEGCGSYRERRRVNGFDAEKFATLSMHGISKFETINRETKEFEYEKPIRETKRESEVGEDEKIVDVY